MRYLYACFENYIGFYNGLGLTKLEIDFTKCQHNIILITGKNGCGKSTLLDALNAFIPNQDGRKRLTLTDEINFYEIYISYPTDNKGGRKQTKAYIKKNGSELNPNGNITTYKDIILSEFDMDSNYISLTKLSSTDRGLGDKRPAERKKFVSSIIDNLEVYNEMYKKLNKKALVFKSQISTIHTKIQNIGTEDQIQRRLLDLTSRNEQIQSKIGSLKDEIVEITTKVNLSQDIIDKMQSIETKKQDIENHINKLEADIKLFIAELKIKPEEISENYASDLALLCEYIETKDQYHNDWLVASERLTGVTNLIHELEVQLETYDTGDSNFEEQYEDTKKIYDGYKSNLEKYSSIISKFDNLTDLLHTLDKFLQFKDSFSERINALYQDTQLGDMRIVIKGNIKDTIEKKRAEIEKTREEMKRQSEQISFFDSKVHIAEVLTRKPKECKISDCPFISEANYIIKVYGTVSDLQNKIKGLKIYNETLQKNIDSNNEDIERLSRLITKEYQYKDLLKFLNDNMDFITLFEIQELYPDKIKEEIEREYRFGDFFSNQYHYNFYNDLAGFIAIKKTYDDLNVQYDEFENKRDMQLKISKKIQVNQENASSLSKSVSYNKQQLDTYSELCNTISKRSQRKAKYNEIVIEQNKYLDQLKELNESMEEYKKQNQFCSIDSVNMIQDRRQQIARLQEEAKPIISEIQNLSGQLTLLQSYYNDLNEYQNQYNILNVLTKYCSPTGGGIQTIFMQMYMDEAWRLVNRVLQMMFGGEYQICKFIINQNEFRIPFIGNGLEVDDISSGSTSQICIMGMAINLVLFHQASSRFNIARLDEIDGGLDHRNRFEFIRALYQIIHILDIQQLFIISHSMEADTSAVDIIKLSPDYDDTIKLGNVIFDYEKEIEKTLE